jgi:hypothetical protein
MADTLQIYGDIAKFDIDGESLIISGILSTPDKDNQGEIVTADAMRKALGEFLYTGTSREMHQPIAAGKPISAYVDDEGKTHVTVKVVDKGTIAKIKEGVLKGFSIGGHALKRAGNKITEILLKDASIVDIPTNPKCIFDVVKFDKPGDTCSDPECKHHKEGATMKCSSCKSKMEKSDKCECGADMGSGMKKCKKCMTKADESEKPMKKMLCKAWNLPETTTDEDFEKELTKRLSGTPTNPLELTLAKMETMLVKTQASLGELEKRASESAARATEAERSSLLQKMQREGRVAMKTPILAYQLDELQKMDLGTLQILAVNAPQLPTQAAHVYKGDGGKPRIPTGADGKALTGNALVEAAYEAGGYGSLQEMNARHNQSN